MKLRHVAMLSLAVLALGGCLSAPSGYSAPPVPAGPDLEGLSAAINGGDIGALVDRSNVPFLLDAEILTRAADVELLWSGFLAGGLTIANESLIREPARSSDYARAANTFDMQALFANGAFLPGDAEWVTVDSSFGELLLIVSERRARVPRIHGIVRVVYE